MADIRIILRSDYKIPDIPEVDIPSFLSEYMHRYSNRTFLIDPLTNTKYTYKQVYDNSRKVAQSLSTQLSLRKGDVILMYSPNCTEYVFAMFGAMMIGVVVSFANPTYTADELLYHINDCEAKAIMTSQVQAGMVTQLARKVGNLQVITFGDAKDCVSFSFLLDNEGSWVPKVSFDIYNDVIGLPYSSGTTGRPKGVMLTHWSLSNAIHQMGCEEFGVYSKAPPDVIPLFVPMYHIYGLLMVMSVASYGGSLVVIPKYELNNFIHIAKKYKASIISIVPPNVVQFAKSAHITKEDFKSARLFVYGAAPVGKELDDEFNHKFPDQRKGQGYGLTESSGLLTLTPLNEPHRTGSVGRPTPNTEIRFVDLVTGHDVGANIDGELWARGPQMMKGYYKREKETRDVIDKDGWFHTGDIGHFDEDGFVYIVDRLKELIKYRGLQVAPADLENLLLSHPSVADCAVVGVPDLEAGELPRAYVTLKPGRQATTAEIQQFVAKQVAPHKKLRGGVRFVDVIPKSPSGKILRRVLKNQIKEEMKLESKL